jgi:serine/threonine protein kinase
MTADAPPSSAPWQRLAPGTRLNNTYEIDQSIGAGGMGWVYKGHQIATGHPVAIKMILPDLERDDAALRLFLTEASALFDVQHDAIVRYYAFAKDSVLGRHFLVLEFVDGRALSDILRDGPLPIEAVRTLLHRLASGLHTVHERGIVHRDVSPDNILIPNSDVARAKIIDFGIAKSSQHGTVIGSGFAGKYSYVSPEQLGLFGGNVTAKSDIYSLALVAVEALNGHPLDMGGSPFEAIEKRRKLPDLGAIDMRIRPLLESMLQPDPVKRPATMAAIAAHAVATEPWPHDQATTAPSDSAPSRRSRDKRNWRRAAILLVLSASAGIAARVYLMPPTPRQSPVSQQPTSSVADITRFVGQYDGGNCFFLDPGVITNGTVFLDGIGAQLKPFEDFSGEFQRTFNFDPKISLRLVTERQCPAVAFLGRLRSELARAPHIDFDQDQNSLRNGEVLSGVIDHYGTLSVDLLLATDAGSVRNVSNLLKPGIDAKTFRIPMQVEGSGGRQPQLLIAVAGAAPIKVLPPGQSADGSEIFPRLLSEAERSGKSLTAATRYLMLER